MLLKPDALIWVHFFALSSSCCCAQKDERAYYVRVLANHPAFLLHVDDFRLFWSTSRTSLRYRRSAPGLCPALHSVRKLHTSTFGTAKQACATGMRASNEDVGWLEYRHACCVEHESKQWISYMLSPHGASLEIRFPRFRACVAGCAAT